MKKKITKKGLGVTVVVKLSKLKKKDLNDFSTHSKVIPRAKVS